jgi:type IV pilus assembly protein PilE
MQRHGATAAPRQGQPVSTHRGASLVGVAIGVTLLLFAVAITLPWHLQRIRTSNRHEAQQYMQAVAAGEQRSLVAAHCYADLATLGIVPPGSVREAYAITLDIAARCGPIPHYRLTLVPLTGQAPDACGTLSIDDAGIKTAMRAHVEVPSCW